MAKKKLHAAKHRRGRRYDHSHKPTMKARAKDQADRRRVDEESMHVVGFFHTADHRLYLKAVKRQPTHNIDKNDLVTLDVRQMARWKSRQAAHQYMAGNGLIAPFQVFNLETILPAAAAGLTN